MPWMAIAASVAGSVVSGAMKSDSAEDARGAQQRGTDAAIDEQRRQFDLTRGDLAPYRDAGGAAVNRLREWMGLGGGNYGAGGSGRVIDGRTGQVVGMPTREQFMRPGEMSSPGMAGQDGGPTTYPDGSPIVNLPTMGSPTFDEAAYNAAMAQYNSGGSQIPADTSGLEFGSSPLLRKFTLADFWDDPVTKASYSMGLEQGQKAITNRAGAGGSRNSGATIKAQTRFATDYTGGQAAGSQARFTGDQTSAYNKLAGLAGTGQQATGAGAMLGQGNANNVSGLLSAQGNANAASMLAGGNARGAAATNVGNSLSNWWNSQNAGGGGGNAANYNSAGTYQPYYTGYDMAGGPAYG